MLDPSIDSEERHRALINEVIGPDNYDYNHYNTQVRRDFTVVGKNLQYPKINHKKNKIAQSIHKYSIFSCVALRLDDSPHTARHRLDQAHK